jgi:hypothetical protein
MSEKYRIRWFDHNPICRDGNGVRNSSWVPATDREEEATEYNDRASALLAREKLQLSDAIKECPKCHGVFRDSELRYIVEKVQDRAATFVSVDL